VSSDEPGGIPLEPVEPEATRGGESVLVVDDEPAVRSLVARVLRGAGYDVLEAEDATRAAERAAAHGRPIDVLLTDMVMPGTSGHDLARLLGADRPAMRVILMSGYTESEVVRQGVRDRNIAFLAKPFLPRDLLALVQRVLTGARPPA
jgi:DNA-binding NtrC family response regulator